MTTRKHRRPLFRKSAIALAVAASAGGGYLMAAPGDPQGDPQQVNVFLPFQQAQGSVAMDDDGDFVVAWASYDQDGSDYAVMAQRYNAAGEPQGSEISVNTFTTFAQEDTAVAMDASGDFVVVWLSEFQDGSGLGIYGQRFDAAGVAQGSEFQVNTTTTDAQTDPAVAMDDDGNFVVVWSGYQDGDGSGIFAQLYDATGATVGGEFQVNTSTSGGQGEARVAMDADGDFVVAWSDAYGADGDADGIFAQRYAADGTPQGGEFQVNTTITANQDKPVVAMDSAGNFVVAWEGDVGDTEKIFAQRYAADGTPQGEEFQVNTVFEDGTADQEQENPRVAMDADGDFVVAWIHENNTDGRSAVFAKYFGADGTVLRHDFALYTSPFNQFELEVAMDAAGGFVASWTGFATPVPWESDTFVRQFAGGEPSDSVEKRTPESVCGSVFFKARSKAGTAKNKAIAEFILDGCEAGAASAVGPELDGRLAKIAARAGDAIEKVGGAAECDPEIQPLLPVDNPDLLDGFDTGEDFLNSNLVTRFCDGVLSPLRAGGPGEAREPADSCAIIHATFVARQGVTRDKAADKYCKKFKPGDAAANDVTRGKLAAGAAKRLSALGRKSNTQVDKLGGTSVCDPDTAAAFPKPNAVDPAYEAAILEERVSFCNDRD